MSGRRRIILLIAVAVAVSGACTTPPNQPYVGRAELMPGLTSIASVTTGERHSCALRTDGTALCWGANRAGEFGNGQTGVQDYTIFPTAVSGLTNAVSLSTGVDHTCAVLSDESAECWGDNARGQLGTVSSSNALTPATVDSLTNAVSIAAGGHFTCALLDDGHVSCWGANDVGQLGNGSTTDASTPVTIPDIDDATAISVGTWTACAVRAGGSVSCWGYNGVFGLLGDGSSGADAYSPDPVTVSGLSGATSVAILSRTDKDDGNVCARLGDGSVWCWGEHILGNGTTNDSPTPVKVSVLFDATTVSASSVACALRVSGMVMCWGEDTIYGLLGDGHANPAYKPIEVHHAGIDTPGVIAISTGTGSGETCGVLMNRTVMCWGIISSPGYAV